MWQPIETAPKDGTRILIYVPGYGVHSARFEAELSQKEIKTRNFIYPELNGMWASGGEIWSDETLEFRLAQPTHWMPLPEPPEQKAGTLLD